ncbi:MAG: VIT1/CCC1 transporter family protein [Acidimicrobiia bacterium]
MAPESVTDKKRLDKKRLDRIQAMYADELAGGELYRGLAEYASEDRRAVFLQLAESESRHAEHWARLLRAADVRVKPPRTPFRVRALCFLARRFGTEAVLPIMLRTEAAEADRYRDDDEATSAMAQQEAAAGRTIAAMQGIPAGGRIARSEGRHHAGVGGMLRAAVFGVNDGLVSNFSLVMGVSGGTHDNSIVVLAGIAGLVAGAFSMASGEWISVRSQRELYENELRIESEELAAFPEEERDELELIYRAKGVTPEAAKALVATIMEKGDVALDTLAREELGLDPAKLGSPWVAAISSFLAFGLGALLPLIPFFFASGTTAIVVSAVLSLSALFAAGATTSVFTGRHAGRAGLRMALIGAAVAVVTYGIGSLVGTSI